MSYSKFYIKSDASATAIQRGLVASIEAWEFDSLFVLSIYSTTNTTSSHHSSHHSYHINQCLVSSIPTASRYHINQWYQSYYSYYFFLLLWYPYFHSFHYAFPNQFRVPIQIRILNQTSQRTKTIQGRAP